ncbi:MAG: hypothetical protein RL477_129, partial [Pseudomonadota bacterium]
AGQAILVRARPDTEVRPGDAAVVAFPIAQTLALIED